jgi:hypothetical protein
MARFEAMIDLPTPPLPEKTRNTSPRRGAVAAPPSASGEAAAAALAWKVPFFCSSWWTRRIEAVSSSPLKGLMRNSRAPACMARRM